mmetsp:Transcript_28465/g.28812  ORF Transcript_28465/g.28812 Transcript_28465/m.28812 type:complete len:81 (+) Transcript_28465:1411-1653(+)
MYVFPAKPLQYGAINRCGGDMPAAWYLAMPRSLWRHGSTSVDYGCGVSMAAGHSSSAAGPCGEGSVMWIVLVLVAATAFV